MKIASIKAELFRVPVKLPRLEEDFVRPLVIVTVETDEGIVGHGLTSGTPHMISAIAQVVNTEIAALVVGMDPVRTEQVWSAVQRHYNRRNLTGVWSSAMAGTDIALWDIKGKALGRSVADLIGGAFDRVPTYITFGVSEYDIATSAEVAKDLVEQGFTRLKMVVGDRPDLEKRTAFWGNGPEHVFVENISWDEDRIRAVRDAVGRDVQLMIDANYMLTAAEAKRLIKRVEDCDIAWFEEPVLGNDPAELAALRRSSLTPIGAGQNFGNVYQHRELLVNESVDIVMTNVCYAGGYTEAIKIANLAKAFNKPIANGAGWPQHNIHLHAGVSNGGYIEFHWSAWKAVDQLFDNAPNPQGPWVAVPTAPGIGFSPNPDAMDNYRVTS